VYGFLTFPYDYLLTEASIDSDVTAVVDAASRAVDIGKPDGKRFDPPYEPSQAEVNSPRDVIPQLGGEFYSMSRQSHLHFAPSPFR
jgi:hypothetical protein